MERKLKTYQIHLKVNGPVFVGDGNEIQKKEYMFLNRNTIGVIDGSKFYMLAKKLHLQNDFERFMIDDTREDLKHWCLRNHVSQNDLKKLYEICRECGRQIRRKRKASGNDLHYRSIWESLHTRKSLERNVANTSSG